MIITYNEKLLRIKCEDVIQSEKEELISILEKELANSNRLGNNGIGLAAPQIGIAKKIAIIRLPNSNIDLVNAEITDAYDLALFKDEGCLSFPGKVENTMRYQEVHVNNPLGYPKKFVATGFLAVACHHELDHLNQKLFTDHLAPKPQPVVIKKIRPNDPCSCGSGKKYKKCCGVNK